jgi:hypothetical protein
MGAAVACPLLEGIDLSGARRPAGSCAQEAGGLRDESFGDHDKGASAPLSSWGGVD